jgi:hypothetical protein
METTEDRRAVAPEAAPAAAAAAARESLTLTADHTTQAHLAALVEVLQAQGFVLTQRTFLPTEEARGVVLLALRRPLPAVAALVVPPTAPAGLRAALEAALFGPTTAPAPATLQLKADDAFVSLNARDPADLAQALGVLGEVAAQVGPTVKAGGEGRLVYTEGVWQVFPDGMREHPALWYDARVRALVAAP